MTATVIKCSINGVSGSEREVEARVDAENKRAFVKTPVLVRFRTGKKTHTSYVTAWLLQDGSYRINSTDTIHNRHARIVGWKDNKNQSNSGWTG